MEQDKSIGLWILAFLAPFFLLPLALSLIETIVELAGPMAPPGAPACAKSFPLSPLCEANEEWQAYSSSQAYVERQQELAQAGSTMHLSARSFLHNEGAIHMRWIYLGIVPSFLLGLVIIVRQKSEIATAAHVAVLIGFLIYAFFVMMNFAFSYGIP